jgi:cytochrome c nitrite reductase small subunit
MTSSRRKLWLVVAIMFGVMAGTGAFTFDYGEGLSYFSKDPAACANCHIMNSEYDSWQKASHHTVAKCVDCHLPHEFIPKYLAKAENGMRHSYGFTFQNFHEPIHIQRLGSRILQTNCMKCHEGMVHNLVAGSTTDQDAVTCVHCHSDVGHGPMK